MNELWNFLPPFGWERLAADAAWQSTLIALGALIAVRLLHRRPALRAAILFSAAALSLAVPLLSTVVRSSGGGWLAPPESRHHLRPVVVETFSQADGLTQSLDPDPPGQYSKAPIKANSIATDRTFDLRPWLVGIWLAASGILAFRLLRGIFTIRRWIRLARPCRDPQIEVALARAAQTIGVRQPELLSSQAFDSPALVMLGRARLLLPAEMPADVDWFAVFCHELAHRARRDDLSRLLVELAVIALPWQPLLWIVRRKFRGACEEACDDWAIAAGADPVEFAALLVALVPERRPAFALGMAESPSATRHRILRLLARRGSVSPRLGWAVGATGWLVAVALAITLAMLQHNSGPEPSVPVINSARRVVPAMEHAPARTFQDSNSNRSLAPPWGNTPLAEAIAKAASDLPKSSGSPAAYVVEPPDVLLIDAVKLVPKSPYQIEPLDMLKILVANPLKDQPISESYQVDPDGWVEFGPAYGKVSVAGRTIDEARTTIETHLKSALRDPQVSVGLVQTSGQQQIAGEHLVGPDGTVNLGTYGTVYVRGMTLTQAKDAVETQLAKYLDHPRVSLDVHGYNSKVYYVITEGLSDGDMIVRVPITGNETVLDALAQRDGKMPKLADCWAWVARSTPDNNIHILPVDLQAFQTGQNSASNWQIQPGDRIFVRPKFVLAADRSPAVQLSSGDSDSAQIRRKLASQELESLMASRGKLKERLRDYEQQLAVLEEEKVRLANAHDKPIAPALIAAEVAKDPVVADFTKRRFELRLAIKNEPANHALQDQLGNLHDELEQLKRDLFDAVLMRLTNAAPEVDATLPMLEASCAALKKSLAEVNEEIDNEMRKLEKLDAKPTDHSPAKPTRAPPPSPAKDHDARRAAKIWDRLGLKLEPVSPEQLHQFQTQYRGGMSIVAIRPDSPAAGQGLRPGDILVGLHIWETTSLEQVHFVINRPDLADAETLKFFILRNNESKSGFMTVSLHK